MTVNLPRFNWPTDAAPNYRGIVRLPSKMNNGTMTTNNQGGLALSADGASAYVFNNYTQLPPRVVELALAAPKVVSAIAQADMSTVKQGFIDPSEGRHSLAEVQGTHLNLGNILVHHGRLHFNMYGVYDANGAQQLTHFSRPLDFKATGDVVGPYKLAAKPPVFRADGTPRTWNESRFDNATLFAATPEVAAAIRASCLTGGAKGNTITTTSIGPAFFAYDPDGLASGSPTTTPLSYYPIAKPLAPWEGTSPLWNGTAKISSAVCVEGTCTILVALNIGVGPFSYGPGGETPVPDWSGHKWAYDPVYKANGTHAYPYENHLMAFDVNDILGAAHPWDVQPYANWKVDLPFTRQIKLLDGSTADRPALGDCGGMAQHPVTKQLLLLQGLSDGDGPLLHYFDVKVTG